MKYEKIIRNLRKDQLQKFKDNLYEINRLKSFNLSEESKNYLAFYGINLTETQISMLKKEDVVLFNLEYKIKNESSLADHDINLLIAMTCKLQLLIEKDPAFLETAKNFIYINFEKMSSLRPFVALIQRFISAQ